MGTRETLAKIGLNYIYAVNRQEKKVEKANTEKNEAILYIYEQMLEMLEKISEVPDREVYIQYGKRIKAFALETKVKIPDVIIDLKEINKLLEE
ncbi:hypothetical protein [Vallitalea guaymasensis]|uniref:hypothetical protein n=1 Tax=Vallitalea guaymasensis TaxID=1185412 RepID=UPI0023559180|nr:hypothetical protein [Vallitalea guaymasensis]